MRLPNLSSIRLGRQDDSPLVHLTGIRPPATPFETWVAAEFAGAESIQRSRLIGRLAEKLLGEELRRGAAQVDAGIWGPALCQREVTLALRDIEGDFIMVMPPSANLDRRSLVAAG